VTALELWPEEGIPENPGAWLMTAAKRGATPRGAGAPLPPREGRAPLCGPSLRAQQAVGADERRRSARSAASLWRSQLNAGTLGIVQLKAA